MRSSSASFDARARVLRAEQLDGLPPEDPRARRARADLRRVHRAMRSVSILTGALARAGLEAAPRRILELGAGDGTLLLRLLRASAAKWRGGELVLLDQYDLVSDATRARFGALGWNLGVLRTDVIEWSRSAPREQYDLCLAALFLHHFQPAVLTELLAAVADRADAFIACEPRRNTLGRIGSRLLILLGANAVTRHDAVASVAAGFADQELSALWPERSGAWRTEEHFAAPFTHCFVARRLPHPRPAPVSGGPPR